MSDKKSKKIHLRVSYENLELMARIRDDHGLSSLSEVIALLLETKSVQF